VLRRRQYFFRAVNQNYCPGSSSYANLYRTYLKNICFYFLICKKGKLKVLFIFASFRNHDFFL
jgi:hypothetical protein